MDDVALESDSVTEILADDSAAGNFSALNSDISHAGNEIKLQKDYIYNSGTDGSYSNGIVIDKDNFVVDGNGHSIYASGLARIFYVTAGDVTIKNLNFINSYVSSRTTPDRGGAIYFNGNAFVENCNFTDNYAYDTGGAMYVRGNGTVINCNFINNTVGTAGGAIFFNQHAEVENCVFDDNRAGSAGGAIQFYSMGSNLKGSVFTNNNAHDGGAVGYSPTAQGSVNEIINCKFLNNLGGQSSGAIESWCDLTIYSCDFTNNSANKRGGAVYFVLNGTVENCNFTNNSAIEEGGAIYFSSQKEQYLVNNSQFYNNQADRGGAIATSGNLTVSNSIFDGNKAAGDSSNVYLENENVNIIEENNTPEYLIPVGFTTLQNLIDNAENEIKLEMDYTYNSDTDGSLSTGIVIDKDNFVVDGQGHVLSGVGHARIFDIRANNVTLKNITLEYGAIHQGGAAYFQNSGSLISCNIRENRNAAVYFVGNGIAENCNFYANSAEGFYGGAIDFKADGTVKNCNFTNNRAGFEGSAIRICGEGIVEDSNFTNNYLSAASQYTDMGGTIALYNKARISGCTFDNNCVGRSAVGSAIYYHSNADAQEVIIENSVFINNHDDDSNYRSFAISIKIGSIKNCYFSNNDGAIVILENVTVDNCNFTNNYPAINVEGYAIISNSNFINNTGKYMTAAIYFFRFDGGVSKVINSTFVNNTAPLGGAICTQSEIVVENSKFINNTANGGDGGAIYFVNNGTVIDCYFENNTAGSYAGAIYFAGQNNQESLVDNSQFYNNQAQTGGAIATKGNITVEYSVFKGNRASANSENIYLIDDAILTERDNIPTLIVGDFASLQNLIDNAENGYLVLGKDYKYSSTDEAFKTQGVKIYKDTFVLDGNGHTIDGANQALIFNIGCKNLVIKNVNFINGNRSWSAAAISSDAAFHNPTYNVTIENCNFTNIDGGSAIKLSETGIIKNCNFVNTTCKVFQGGAILLYSSLPVTIYNCNFTNTSSDTDGGAIFSMAPTTIENCNFYNTEAYNCEYGGGAVYISNVATLINSNFYNCKSNKNGGAVYLINKESFIRNCVFISNTAVGGDAGAVYFQNNGTVLDCYFENNTANSYAGAIYFAGTNKQNLVNNSQFYDNDAHLGGAIAVSSDITIKNSIFEDNTASGTSYNIYLTNTNIKFIDENNTPDPLLPPNFTSLQAEINSAEGELKLERDYIYTNEDHSYIKIGEDKDNFVLDGQGHTIDGAGMERILTIYANNVTIKNVNFINGDVSGSGGAIFFSKSYSAEIGTLQNCNFTNNTAAIESGAVDCDISLTMENCNFNNNTAGYCGAGSFKNSTIINCNFTNNIARYREGAILAVDSRIINCNFINNEQQGDEYGGAIAGFNCSITGCNFTGNTAKKGGAVYIYYANTDETIIKNCVFINNTATGGCAGAVFFISNGTVLDSYFENNKASTYGGAIYFNGENKQNLVNNSKFYDNQAQKGGAIATSSDLTVTNSIFDGNKGSGITYNIYLTNNNAKLIEENNTPEYLMPGTFSALQELINNAENNYLVLDRDYFYDPSSDEAYDEGVVIPSDKDNFIIDGHGHTISGEGLARILLIRGDNAVLKNINFIDANFYGSGGAVWSLAGDNVTIQNCNFTNNTAARGSAIYLSGDATVINCIFTSNHDTDYSQYGGGIIDIQGEHPIVDNCVFINNTAKYGVCHFDDGQAIVKNSIFKDNNAADYGGAICIMKYAEGIIKNCTFINNTANDTAGAIYFKNSGSVLDSYFENNSATNSAGAIYFKGEDKQCLVNNSEFYGNHAPTGGAIVTNSDLTVTNSIFNGNKASGNTYNVLLGKPNLTLIEENNTPEHLIPSDFAALQYQIDNAENNCIVLDRDCVYTESDSAYQNGVKITSDNFVVDGNGFTIDGKGLARIFVIEGNNVTLKNIKLINGYSDNSGGAVYFAQNGTVLNSTFINNTIPRGYYQDGGAIRAKNLIVRDSNFTKNSGHQGGAIYIEETGTLTNCLFKSNNGYYGGSLNIGQNANISNCKFIDNILDNGGGGYGAAIYFDNNGTVDNCIFDNNNAGNTYGYGGAIQLVAGTGIIRNSNFTNNRAALYGGAINIQNGNIINCNFDNNNGSYGGAIHAYNELTVVDSTFTNNFARNSGGAIWSQNNLNVDNSLFDNNTADGKGAIYTSQAIINNSNFTNNRAIGPYYFDNGGAVSATHASITYCNFINNSALYDAGAIISTELSLNYCNFTNNHAAHYGGALCINENATIMNSNFKGNNATIGGAIYINQNASVTDSTFEANNADDYGGALYINENATIMNSNFKGNDATKGGAIYINQNASVIGSTFDENHADDYGGAVYIEENGTIMNSNFKGNDATRGGAIYINQNASVTDSTFESNNADIYGGGIYVHHNATIKGSNFTNNKALLGGAIYFEENGTVKESNFKENNAGSGGAIYIYKFASIIDSTFDANNAEDTGGAINVYYKVTIKGSNFTNNKAEFGGAIKLHENATVEGSNFENNHASRSGGAIYALGKNSIRNSNFTGNIAEEYAGALYATGEADVFGSNFTQNRAGTKGGAIYFSKNAELTGSYFFNNTAPEGGAIYLQSDNLNSLDNDYIANFAEKGGAIYVYSGKIYLNEDRFENNTATLGTNNIHLNGDSDIDLYHVTPNSSKIVPFKISDVEVISITGTSYGENLKILVNVTCEGKPIPSSAINYRIIEIEPGYHFANTENGIATIELGNYKLNAGKYNIELDLIIWGWSIYTRGPQIVEVQVTPKVVNVKVDNPSSISYGESLKVALNLSDESVNSGTAYVIIDDKSYSTNITNGTAIVEIPNLDAGTYDGMVLYLNDNYLGLPAYFNVTVEKQNATITAGNETYVINYGGNYCVEVDNAIGENVVFTLDGVNIGSATVDENGIATIEMTSDILKTAKAGVKVLVIELGSENYNCSAKTVEITINKEATDLTADSIVTVYGVDEDLTITLKDSQGKAISGVNVSVNLNGVENYTTDENGTIKVSTKGLGADDYTAKITFRGNEVYIESNTTANVKIQKANSTINVDDVEMDYNGSVDVEVTTEGASAITAEIDGIPIDVDGYVITISGLSAGVHNLTVATEADANHTSVNKTVKVTVNTINSTLTVNDVEMDYGTSINVPIETEGATGITAEIDGVPVNINDYIVPVSGLSAGKHYLTVATIADENHTSVTKTVNITVNKVNSTLNINNVEMDYGTSVNVPAETEGATGITAEIDGIPIGVIGNMVTISGLNAGIHNLTVTAIPDENHTSLNKTVRITVNTVNSTLNVNDVEMDYGTSVNVTVETEGATGITAEIDGTPVETIGNMIPISDLAAGIYNLTVTTIHDANHTSVNKTVRVTVKRVNSTLNIGDVEMDYGTSLDVNVETVGATGITAEIDGVPIDVDGYVIPISGLSAGVYNLTVTTEADANHTSVNKTVKVTVNKINSTLTVNDIEIDYGISDDVEVTTQGASGISAKIDGVEIEVYGFAIHISGLSAGKHYLTVVTIADENHTSVTKTVNITVSKVDSNLTVDDVEMDYGTIVNVPVETEGATGITAEIDNVAIGVIGNMIPISGLDAGIHNLTVTTIPDENHTSVNKTIKITVNNVNSTLNVNDVEMDYGTSVDVNVETEGATGINAEIDGVPIDVDGFIIPISGLSAGIHNLTVTTIADANHTSVNKTVKVTVKTVNSTLSVDDVEMDYGTSIIVPVETVGATGINAEIDGVPIDVDGFIIPISGLSAGSYNLTVTTIADANHTSVNKTVRVTVNKVNSTLIVDDVEMDYGTSVDVNVETDGATDITAEIDGNTVETIGNSIPISGLDAGTHYLTVATIADANHTSVNKTVKVIVKTVNSTLSVDDVEMDYGTSVNVSVETEGATGITAEIDNVAIGVIGNVIPIFGLDAGVYNMTVTTTPDGNHKSVNKTVKITVKTVNSTLSVDDVEMDYGTSLDVNVETVGATGITAEIDGNPVETIGNVIPVSGLDAGTYNLTVTTNPDGNHNSVNKTVKITVKTVNSTLTVDDVEMDYGTSVNVNVETEGATEITAKIDGVPIEVSGNVIPISGLTAGTYNLTVTTIPDGNHNSVNKTVKVTVNKVNSTLSVDDVEMDYGTSVNVSVETVGATGITAEIDGNPVETIGNMIPISGLNAGTHYLTVTTNPDENHTSVTKTVKVTVNKANSTLNVDDVVMDYGTSVNVDVTTQGASGITAKIDGIAVGVIGNIIPISGLGAGTHHLTVTTIPDANHNEANKTVNIIVNKVDSSISVENVVMDYGSSVNITATTQGATGITAEIDGKEIAVSGNVIVISGLSAGTHYLTVTTIPDSNHTSVNRTANITVNKLNSIITASDKAYVINYGGTYEIVLKDVNGIVLANQKVSFTLNGKNIGSAVTNANGVAGIKLTASILKTAKAGTKNLIVKFEGDTNYNAASKTVKITINKEKTKIKAKKKTFKKSKKVKKYTIALKNSKNKAVKKVKVTLKVKGKTYRAKTNAKGKATFKIKKLTKKGTFKATIKFKGNAFYNKVTKKVKIKIR